MSANQKGWPHAPPHQLSDAGAYMITCGTYGKLHHFRRRERLDILERELLAICLRYGWELQAWAVFSNHYHFVAHSPEDPGNLSEMLLELHSSTATCLNRLDNKPGRQVWYNFWDKHLTYEKSYLARLNYTNTNAVKHGLVHVATDYPWCSAPWFESSAPTSFQRTVASFKTDKLNVLDPFDAVLPDDF